MMTIWPRSQRRTKESPLRPLVWTRARAKHHLPRLDSLHPIRSDQQLCVHSSSILPNLKTLLKMSSRKS